MKVKSKATVSSRATSLNTQPVSFSLSLLGEVSLIFTFHFWVKFLSFWVKVKSQQSVSSRATNPNTLHLSIFTFYFWVKFHSFSVKFLSFWAK